MAFLRSKIDHVIYVVKENRTYDQVLGDLPVGNGDLSLTLLPQPITPNHHALALDFVTLDNLRDSGAVQQHRLELDDRGAHHRLHRAHIAGQLCRARPAI